LRRNQRTSLRFIPLIARCPLLPGRLLFGSCSLSKRGRAHGQNSQSVDLLRSVRPATPQSAGITRLAHSGDRASATVALDSYRDSGPSRRYHAGGPVWRRYTIQVGDKLFSDFSLVANRSKAAADPATMEVEEVIRGPDDMGLRFVDTSGDALV
jgi:hypothetical protein